MHETIPHIRRLRTAQPGDPPVSPGRPRLRPLARLDVERARQFLTELDGRTAGTHLPRAPRHVPGRPVPGSPRVPAGRYRRDGGPMSTAYSRPAAEGITQAARSEHDFAGWLAVVLATAAAATGSRRAGRRPPRIVRGQPGDAARARHVGWDDEDLPVRSRTAQHLGVR